MGTVRAYSMVIQVAYREFSERLRPLRQDRSPWYAPAVAGSGAARLARSVRDAEVGGSNPLSPTVQERPARPLFFVNRRGKTSAPAMS